MHVLSVDLGTSNTVAVLAAHGREPRALEIDGSATMPSAVFAAEDGSLVVGRDAERRARLDPARFEPNPKRRVDEQELLLGDRVVRVVDALAAVLHRVAQETARQLGGQRPGEVRLTHPAQWGQQRRRVLLAAAHAAGLGQSPVLVPEPVAAAAHFASFPGKGLAPGRALAVYDLGAGTFDCAVVGATQNGYAVLAEDGLADLGGLDVDQALAEHVGRQVSGRDPGRWQRLLRPESTADRRAQRALREDVRAAKEALSRHPQTDVPMPEPFHDVLVTRQELESLVRPSLLRSVELLAAVVRRSGFTPDRLAGIYLVGGSSRIPLVATLLGESLRVVPTSLDQPETAVALGAHHVSRAGIAGRTQEFGNRTPPARPAPLPNNFPTAGVAAPPSGPQPAGAGRRTPRKRGLLAAAAAVVVVALLVVGGVILLRGDGQTVSASECEDYQAARDGKGFTACLRQLAGGVADSGNCSAGGVDNTELAKLGGIDVTCRRGTHTISYKQSPSASKVADAVDVVVSDGGDKVQARWQGNGLSGRYIARASSTIGLLVFTVDDRPVSGTITQVPQGGTEPPDAGKLADYFEQRVQPGT